MSEPSSRRPLTPDEIEIEAGRALRRELEKLELGLPRDQAGHPMAIKLQEVAFWLKTAGPGRKSHHLAALHLYEVADWIEAGGFG